jgi:hypothetical protein
MAPAELWVERLKMLAYWAEPDVLAWVRPEPAEDAAAPAGLITKLARVERKEAGSPRYPEVIAGSAQVEAPPPVIEEPPEDVTTAPESILP